MEIIFIFLRDYFDQRKQIKIAQRFVWAIFIFKKRFRAGINFFHIGCCFLIKKLRQLINQAEAVFWFVTNFILLTKFLTFWLILNKKIQNMVKYELS